MAELNEEKCKELGIDFSRQPTENTSLHSIFINHKEIKVVSYAKTLGLTVRNDFKCKMHIDNIISKASKRLHLITQLKRAQVPVKDLIQIYCACIRSTLEVPQYLSSDIERIQRRCLRKIFPENSYEEAFELANLETLRNRREAACKKLFLQADSDTKHKLHQKIPKENGCTYPLRKCHKCLVPKIRTECFNF
jgi:hypothetical protein